ncbi:MAG: hypothetical protein ACM3X5_04490 [Bacillota bacterium]
MRRRSVAFLLFLSLAAAPARSQVEGVPAPDNWKRESFDFPLAFAPGIGFEGKEHVRFAPGWGNFAGEHGFSYVFLWDVKTVSGPAMTVYGLEFALGGYFDGLMEGVANARRLDVAHGRSVIDLHPMLAVAGWDESHAGELHTWNAFSKGEPLAVHMEVTKRACPGDRTQIFFALSPRPRSESVWNDLRSIRGATKCAAAKG